MLILSVPGLNVNARNDENKTALILASGEGPHKAFKLLFAVPGIDINAKVIENKTDLFWASRRIIEQFLE